MNAVLSGQAGTAVCIDKDRMYSVSVDDTQVVTERNPWDIPLIFADAKDIKKLKNVTHTEVVESLTLAWRQDRCLQLILILLDTESDQEIREASAGCIDEFMEDDSVTEFVANRLYSASLPDTADLDGALAICQKSFQNKASRFLTTLKNDQDRIGLFAAIWNGLPSQMFGGVQEKSSFHAKAVKNGVFRSFALKDANVDYLLIQYLSHPAFRGEASKARAVFQAIANPLRKASVRVSVGNGELETEDATGKPRQMGKHWVRGQKVSYSHHNTGQKKGYEVFQKVERQREAIKKLLAEGLKERALRFVDQLVTSQRRDSKPEHIAKSLCDLAQFSKDELDSPELQLQLALRAVSEAPKDAFAYAVVGDAYRALGEFPQAQQAYYNAGLLGDERIELVGRSELFKDMGQFNHALESYKACIVKYPQDQVILNGLASVLATSGNLDGALKVYDNILTELGEDIVTLAGRAQVLRDMGHLEESLEALTEIAKNYPTEVIPLSARGEVLRELGMLNKALQAFIDIQSRFPSQIEASLGIARVLRDMGRIPEAIEEYKRIKRTHPSNYSACIGLADTYKKIGDLVSADQEYDYVIQSSKRVFIAKNGKASILIVQGRYAEALDLLPEELPATQGEWIAYHIRGMAYMKSGQLQRAEEVFIHGIASNPWPFQRQYFKTALAVLRLQQQNYDQALALTKDVTLPAISPIAHILSMHAFGEIGDRQRFDTATESIQDTSAPVIIDLKKMLISRYNLNSASTIFATRNSTLQKECDSLLLAV